jgi:hypothetical protein
VGDFVPQRLALFVESKSGVDLDERRPAIRRVTQNACLALEVGVGVGGGIENGNPHSQGADPLDLQVPHVGLPS